MAETTLTASQETSRRSELFSGIRAELPLLIGVVPFGMVYGVVAVQAGLSAGLAQAMSSIVFAGSAQFVAAVLLGQSVPLLLVVATAAVLNLRHLFYSASVAPHIRNLPGPWKYLLAYLLTDEAYAVTIVHYSETDPLQQDHHHWFFLGAGLTLWTSWQISTMIGIFFGLNVPPEWSLDFALALTFIAMLVPMLKDRPNLFAALTSGLCALAFAGLPYKLGLVLAALAGILAGTFVERLR